MMLQLFIVHASVLYETPGMFCTIHLRCFARLSKKKKSEKLILTTTQADTGKLYQNTNVIQSKNIKLNENNSYLSTLTDPIL